MEYAYKITTNGRAVMAACMDLGAPFRVTRAAFGKGLPQETDNLADLHRLIEYVSDGSIINKSHDRDRFEFTIQFANVQHPEVKTFLLSEFIVYVKDPETGEDTDLLYGTLGDYRQPVPGYNPAFPPSVFNFPLTVILSDEINVEVSAAAGLATWDDMAGLAQRLAARRYDLTIPKDGWEEDPEGRRALRRDIPVEGAGAEMVPQLTILPEGEGLADACGLAPFVQALEGSIRVWAAAAPSGPIPASLLLQGDSSGLVLSGGIKVAPGSGLSVDSSGNLTLDTATGSEVAAIFNGSKAE